MINNWTPRELCFPGRFWAGLLVFQGIFGRVYSFSGAFLPRVYSFSGVFFGGGFLFF